MKRASPTTAFRIEQDILGKGRTTENEDAEISIELLESKRF